MGRILFWLILGFLFWLLVRILLKQRSPEADKTTASPGREQKQLTMAQCAYCGIHFPLTEAVQAADGRAYCTQAHHDQARHTHGA